MEKEKQLLTVYRKKSTFKGATDKDFWYSATRSDGCSVKCIFKCAIPTESAAFVISNVVGTMKVKTVEKNDVLYSNFTYYITSAEFHEIEGTELPL